MSSSLQSSRSSPSTPFATCVLDDQGTYPNLSGDDPINMLEHGSLWSVS
jgi:hypothetical protein